MISWSDEGYDEIDYLIDNDSIELGQRYRALRQAVRHYLQSPDFPVGWGKLKDLLGPAAQVTDTVGQEPPVAESSE